MGRSGVGSGGVNAVTRIYAGWQDGPRCAVVDTDEQVLSLSPVERSLQVGASVAGGQGAGGDLQVGRSAGENDADQIAALVRGFDVVFLVATLGGGTGSGVSPTVAAKAHAHGHAALGRTREAAEAARADNRLLVAFIPWLHVARQALARCSNASRWGSSRKVAAS